MKSRLPQPEDVDCQSIRCNEIVVTSIDGVNRARIGSSSGRAGELRLYGPSGQPSVVIGTDSLGKYGRLETWDDQQNRRAVVGGDANGGHVRLFDKTDAPSLFLGYDGKHSLFGLCALNDEDKPLAITHQDKPILWGMQLPLPLPKPGTGATQAEPKAAGEPNPGTADATINPVPNDQ